jgi:hypothetical protein
MGTPPSNRARRHDRVILHASRGRRSQIGAKLMPPPMARTGVAEDVVSACPDCSRTAASKKSYSVLETPVIADLAPRERPVLAAEVAGRQWRGGERAVALLRGYHEKASSASNSVDRSLLGACWCAGDLRVLPLVRHLVAISPKETRAIAEHPTEVYSGQGLSPLAVCLSDLRFPGQEPKPRFRRGGISGSGFALLLRCFDLQK